VAILLVWEGCGNVSKKIYKVVASKFSKDAHTHDFSFSSSLDDVSEALKQLLESRRVKVGGQTCAVVNRSSDMTQDAQAKVSKDPPPVTQVIQATNEKVNETEEADEEMMTKPESSGVDVPGNLFDSLSPAVLKSLQTYIDENGLGTEEGTKRLANIVPNSQEFIDLANRLAQDTGLSFAEATKTLTKWQDSQKNLEAMIEKEKQKTKIVGTRPIWRCGVCGMADKPGLLVMLPHSLWGMKMLSWEKLMCNK
jgi:hypothetical protein